MQLTSWQNSRVFITGATGLLGAHLTRQLVNSGAYVVALVRDFIPKSIFFDSDDAWKLDRRVVIVHGEVENYAVIERTLNEYEIDTVFHLAAQTIVSTANRGPLATFRANIEGTWNVLEAARVHSEKIVRVIIASSDKAYGNLAGEAYDETFPLRGEHPYDVSKSCADLIARSYFKTFDLPVVVSRCGNFFGPGDLNFSRLIPGTIRDVVQGRCPIIRSDGNYIRDYLFVEDGAQAYMALAEALMGNKSLASPARSQLAGEAFNFSYGIRVSVLEVVEKIMAMMGRADLKPTILNEATNEIPVQCLNSEKARRLLGWKPQVGFDDGLMQTITWYKEFLATPGGGVK